MRGAIRNIVLMGSLVIGTSGCMMVGPAVGLVAMGGINRSAVDTQVFANEASRMNCSQLRKAYSDLNKNPLGALSSQNAIRKSVVVDLLYKKGCQLPAGLKR